jgi:hypothetical protein
MNAGLRCTSITGCNLVTLRADVIHRFAANEGWLVPKLCGPDSTKDFFSMEPRFMQMSLTLVRQLQAGYALQQRQQQQQQRIHALLLI